MYKRIDKRVIVGFVALLFTMILSRVSSFPTYAIEQERIKSFDVSELAVEVDFATRVEDVLLPETLKAVVLINIADEGEEEAFLEEDRDVPVSWSCDNYNPNVPSDYVFVAILPIEYALEGNMPYATVTMAPETVVGDAEEGADPSASDSSSVQDSGDISEAGESESATEKNDGETAESSSEAEAKPALPDMIVSLKDFEQKVDVPFGTRIEDIVLPNVLVGKDGLGAEYPIEVTWDCEEFNGSVSGEYIFKAVLPQGLVLAEALVAPLITVTVQSQSLPGVIVSFKEFEQKIDVPFGTQIENIALPSELVGIDGLGAEYPIDVTWECEEFNAGVPGEYIFKAVLPQELILAEALAQPQITVTVPPQSTEIEYFCGGEYGSKGSYMLIRILAGDAGDADPSLPEQIGVILSDGNYTNIYVSWNGDYNGNRNGTYTLEMLINGYTYNGTLPYAQVIVGPDPMVSDRDGE